MTDQPSTGSENWRYKPGKRDVVIGAIVNVKVLGVEATSDDDAIEKACEGIDFGKLFRQEPPKGIEYVEWAEGVASYLVDHKGDENYCHSTWYKDGVKGVFEDNDPIMPFEKYILETKNTDAAIDLVKALAIQERWFLFQPLADGSYEIVVKLEIKKEAEALLKLAEFGNRQRNWSALVYISKSKPHIIDTLGRYRFVKLFDAWHEAGDVAGDDVICSHLVTPEDIVMAVLDSNTDLKLVQ